MFNNVNVNGEVRRSGNGILPDFMFDARERGREMLGSEADRTTPWAGIGSDVSEVASLDEVIRLSGLDFTVAQKELPLELEGVTIPTGHFANYRTDTNELLGVVKGRYTIVNNSEAFEFVEDIVKNGDIPVQYDTAGVLKGGKKVWISCKLPSMHVLGDEYHPNLFFGNSHDGSMGITVSTINIRVWCQNTFNIAVKKGKRVFHFTHCASVKEKMEDAKKTLENYQIYQKSFEEEANRLYSEKLTAEEVKAFYDELFPISEDMSDTKMGNIIAMREAVEVAYMRDDNKDFRGTKWGLLNGVSDMASHMSAFRKVNDENQVNATKMMAMFNGYKVLDLAYAKCA